MLFLSKNKKKWDESFSRVRAMRKGQKQRAPPPLPTRFTRTEGASVVVTEDSLYVVLFSCSQCGVLCEVSGWLYSWRSTFCASGFLAFQ